MVKVRDEKMTGKNNYNRNFISHTSLLFVFENNINLYPSIFFVIKIYNMNIRIKDKISCIEVKVFRNFIRIF